MAPWRATFIAQRTLLVLLLAVSDPHQWCSSSRLGLTLGVDAIELMFVGIGFIFVPATVLSYVRINRKRDAVEKAALESGQRPKYTTRELQMLGDRAPDFRYTL